MAITKFKRVIAGHKRIGLDSMGFIYFLEDNPRFADLAEVVFESAEKGHATIVSSVLATIEILTGYRKAKDIALEDELKQMLQDFPNIEIHDLDASLIDRVVDLRAKYNIKTPDAIHIATAIERMADIFLTNDSDLVKIKEIKIIYLGDYAEK